MACEYGGDDLLEGYGANAELRRAILSAGEVEEILDEVLQAAATVVENRGDLALLVVERAHDLVAQQLTRFPDRGQWRLELVGDVAQEACLLVLELHQALAQPVQPLAENLQVPGAGDLDRGVELFGAEPANGAFDLADWAGDEHREYACGYQRERQQGRAHPEQPALRHRAEALHAGDLAVDDVVTSGADTIGELAEADEALRDRLLVEAFGGRLLGGERIEEVRLFGLEGLQQALLVHGGGDLAQAEHIFL